MYQSTLYYHYSETKLSNGFLLNHSDRDLLRIPDPLFLVNYFLNKHN